MCRRLREAGALDEEILEINQVCCYFNYVNRLLNGLGVTLDGDNIGYYSGAAREYGSGRVQTHHRERGPDHRHRPAARWHRPPGRCREAWLGRHPGRLYLRREPRRPPRDGRAAREAALRFFQQPVGGQARRSLQTCTTMAISRPGETKMYDDAKVDLKESFQLGYRARPKTELADESRNPLLGPNRWPEFLPELKAGRSTPTSRRLGLRGRSAPWLCAGLPSCRKTPLSAARTARLARLAPVLPAAAGRPRAAAFWLGLAHGLRRAHRAVPGRHRRACRSRTWRGSGWPCHRSRIPWSSTWATCSSAGQTVIFARRRTG